MIIVDLSTPFSTSECSSTESLVRTNFHQKDEATLHVMRLDLAPGFSYPSHYHLQKAEFYISVFGVVTIKFIGKIIDLAPGMGLIVQPREIHAVLNRTTEYVTFVEIRPGPFDPEDSVKVKT